ncbi:hypothetical protein SUVZ_15G2440 [Saccharomyces uvarum]|uniref:Ribosome maturation protein SDO1/SBDS N-terminal domain-containing protein n=1 Tax=Saccharomyces uvarum TaxID=230603 RepID=A0ABN8WLH7_SACUV|nr:hypothetical protein SUVZ_15G2440 [Saccharomyces uvarum]
MSTVIKYFYKGENTDLIIFATSEELVNEYLENPSIGKLSEVVEVFEVFTPLDGRGAEGELGAASKAQVENEFGKGKKTEEVIDLILKNGEPNSVTSSLKTKGNAYK